MNPLIPGRLLLLIGLIVLVPACGRVIIIDFPLSGPFVIVGFSPANSATEVGESDPVTVTFSEKVDVASISGATFSVSSLRGPVTGTLQVTDEVVTFHPTKGWPLGTLISVVIDTAVQSVGARSLSAGATWTFVSRCPVWSAPILLQSNGSVSGRRPRVAMNSSGVGVVTWLQSDGTRDNIWARLHDPRVGWGAATLLETDGGFANVAEVATSTAGNATVVWIQYDGTRNNIYANRYAPGIGWSGRELVDSEDLGDTYSPSVAMDPAGSAMVIWLQEDMTILQTRIWARRYDVVTGWETATPLEAPQPSGSAEPTIAAGPDGSFMAVWWRGGGPIDVVSSRHSSAGGWTVPVTVSPALPGTKQYPQVVRNEDGLSMLAWVSGPSGDIWSNHADATGNWSGPVPAESDPLSAGAPRVTLDHSGTATAIWPLGTPDPDLVVARRPWGGSWEPTTILGTGMHGNVDPHDLGSDVIGNIEVVWGAADALGEGVRSRRYIRGVGWQPAQPVHLVTVGVAGQARVVLDADGRGMAAWNVYDGVITTVWASHLQ